MPEAKFVDLLLTALMQARIIKAAYLGRYAVERLAKEVGARYRFVTEANSCAAVLIFDDHIHLSVVGTNDRHDWVDNLNMSQTQFRGMSVHAGFARCAGHLADELTRCGFFDLAEGRDVIVGGHSSGGAIAALLTVPDRRRFVTPREVITFGAPRVFTPDSAIVYGAYSWEVLRFALPGDPVPHLPLKKFRALFGKAEYAHASQSFTIKDDGSVVAEHSAGILGKIARIAKNAYLYGVLSILAPTGKIARVLDKHSITRYMKAIEVAIASRRV